MKFAFMVVTRGNPLRASAVIEVAKSLASGKHEIKYIVGCDDDDPKTSKFFRSCKDVIVTEGPRPYGLGAAWNRCVEVAGDADIYCPFPDDSFISLPDWDEFIADKKTAILAWNDLANPSQCTLPIVSREWLNIVGGRLYDDRFPFWFYDTCVDELFSFVTGTLISIPQELVLSAKKGLTKNMRDLSFWWDFYVATRSERLVEAAIIRKRLGIEMKPEILSAVVASWEARDVIGRASAMEIERMLSADGSSQPSPQYLRAKADASAYGAKAA